MGMKEWVSGTMIRGHGAMWGLLQVPCKQAVQCLRGLGPKVEGGMVNCRACGI